MCCKLERRYKKVGLRAERWSAKVTPTLSTANSTLLFSHRAEATVHSCVRIRIHLRAFAIFLVEIATVVRLNVAHPVLQESLANEGKSVTDNAPVDRLPEARVASKWRGTSDGERESTPVLAIGQSR